MKIIFLIPLFILLNIAFAIAQGDSAKKEKYKNAIEFGFRQIAYTDLKGTDFLVLTDISYFRTFGRHFLVKFDINTYQVAAITNPYYNPNTDQGKISDRAQTEIELGFGYKNFHLRGKSFYRLGLSAAYRERDDDFIGFYGGTGWYESYDTYKTIRDYGLSIWGDYNIFIGKHFTVGAYLRSGWYNNGPGSTYYGVQVGYQL